MSIELAMKYNGEEDIVTATAIWVENTKIWKTREPCSPLPDCFGGENPKAGHGRLLGLDEGVLRDIINVDRVSKDGSRYGHGYNSKVPAPTDSEDMGFGGRVLFEYAILPTNTDLLEFNIEFDCTRRRETRSMKSKHGDIPGNVEIGGASYMDFPPDSDTANDDAAPFDEDNIPTKPDGSNEWRIYAWDRPGISNIGDGNTYSFWATKNNFEEYVRVKFDGSFSSNGNGLYGSRVSEKTKWHCVYYTKSGAGNKLEPDMQPISFSNPKKVGPGNGSCIVETFPDALNSAYTAYYIPSTTEWGLSRKNSGVVAKANVLPGSDPRKWILDISGIIRVTITEGVSSFGDNSRYEFSVFKTSIEKINKTDIGHISIDNSF